MTYIKKRIFFLFLLVVGLANAQEILTKKKALEIALKNNYDIKMAHNNLEIAKNNSSIYNTGFLPTFSASAGADYDNDNIGVEFQNGESTQVNGAETKSYNASLNLSYTLFDGLGRKYNYKQLKETYNLTELQVRATIEDMYLQLFNGYFEIARLLENTKNLQETLKVSKDRFKRAEYQYEYGQSTKLELLNAQVDINNDSINVINAKQQYANAKRNLNIIMGIDKNTPYNVETTVSFNGLINLNDALSKALAKNVTLLQTDKNIAINEFNIKVNKAGYMPTVALSSSYGWNKSINPITSFNASSNVTGINLGIDLSWNIFDGGSTKTNISNAKIALDNEQILKKQQEDIIRNTVKNTYELYQNKLFILETQTQNKITSQNNFDRTKEQYKLGQVTSIEFRQAQINLLNTETALSNAKYDAKLVELELLQLTGDILNIKL